MINWYNTIGIIKHYLTAWNTGGENIHSPSLFYFVRMILYDKNQYYASIVLVLIIQNHSNKIE